MGKRGERNLTDCNNKVVDLEELDSVSSWMLEVLLTIQPKTQCSTGISKCQRCSVQHLICQSCCGCKFADDSLYRRTLVYTWQSHEEVEKVFYIQSSASLGDCVYAIGTDTSAINSRSLELSPKRKWRYSLFSIML